MTLDRIKLCALAAAVAATLTGEVAAQGAGQAPAGASGVASPASGSGATPTPAAPGAGTSTDATRPRNDPAGAPTRAPASTQSPAARGLANGGQGAGAAASATGASNTSITGGVPAMSGVTPNRAELSSSAFTKLDAGQRGYLTLEDVRQLGGFESAFRQADANGDGRLNASEFNSAWGAYTGNVR